VFITEAKPFADHPQTGGYPDLHTHWFGNIHEAMKHITPIFGLALALGAFAFGCRPSGENAATELTANELALLQDFHAWKLPVPQSQQPLKRVTLVLVRADGTSVQLFGTAYSDTAPAWTNILLGFRYESGRFVGHFEGRSPSGGAGYSLDFTNAATAHLRSWGAAHWQGNRALLGTFWTSGEAAKSGGNDFTTLAVELVK
jgi:hypothetical protein